MFNEINSEFDADFNGITVHVVLTVRGSGLEANDDGPLGTGFVEGSIPTINDLDETFAVVNLALIKTLEELEALDENRKAVTVDPLFRSFRESLLTEELEAEPSDDVDYGCNATESFPGYGVRN